MKKKIKRSIARRFKVTKNGKVMFEHQYSSHLKLNKSKRRLRRIKEPGQLKGKFAQNIKKMLGEA
jgi:large subunit ribosomal protein L35